MSPLEVGIIGTVFLLVLFFLGVPIGFSMAIAGIAGFAYVVNPSAALNMAANDVFSTFSSYGFSVLPMFILMGSLAFASGIGNKAYNVGFTWMGELKGGLIIATTIACAIFGSVCGSGAATCAAIGKTAVPEIKRHNYNPAISLGALACAGTLGFMIPPSSPFIIYGILTEQSIGKLFIAGVLPGILLTVLFIITILVVCQIRPSYGPAGPHTTFGQKMKSLLGLLDAMVLFVLVIGGLFAGFFSPTMAGAIGSAGAIVIGVVRREMTWKRFIEGLRDSLRMSCMILVLVFGAIIFGHFITATNLAQALVNWVEVSGMSSVGIIIFVSALFFILGFFIDITPILLLLVPLFYPLILKSGYDVIWFGVIVVTLCMIGIVTPPVATNLYVVKGLVRDEVSLNEISKGIFIFLIPMVVGLIILIAVPPISTWLPSFMTY
jgi:C4-dicarboxylate transporter, DctM subunit